MANVWNGYAKQYTSVLDEGIVQAAKTGFFADPEFKAKFVGTKEVLVPSIEMTGLGNYVRVGDGNANEGYPAGRSVITYKAYTLAMDRARKLPFDAQDVDESGVNGLIAKVTSMYKTNHISPEVDAYNNSKLFAYSESGNHSYSVDTATAEGKTAAVDKFLETLVDVEETVGFNGEETVAIIDRVLWGTLMNSDKFSKQITVGDFKHGNIDTKIKEINGVKLIVVDSARMKSKYDFDAGTSTESGGFAPASGAKNIRALILPKASAKFVKKLDDLKVFSPEENQNGNGWIVDFHMYYDLFVMKSRENTIFSLYE